MSQPKIFLTAARKAFPGVVRGSRRFPIAGERVLDAVAR